MAKLSEESRSWTLDDNPQALKAKSQLMFESWDTMGLVLFQEGKTAEAEGYLRAAWMNRQDAMTGLHLGDILSARGDKIGAAKMYRLALATIPSFNTPGLRRDPAVSEKALDARLKAVGGVVAKSSMQSQMDGAKGLQELRKIPLGSAGESYGTSEYRLLLNANSVERMKQVGARKMEGGDALVKRFRTKNYLPPGVNARVVRAGILNCHQQVCELVLEP